AKQGSWTNWDRRRRPSRDRLAEQRSTAGQLLCGRRLRAGAGAGELPARCRSEWDRLAPEDRAAELVRAGSPALGVRLETSPDGGVWARANVVLRGYWERPDETEKALDGAWFHTGDGGTIGDDGYLTISDRRKDVIITGGENVSSIEVEDALSPRTWQLRR